MHQEVSLFASPIPPIDYPKPFPLVWPVLHSCTMLIWLARPPPSSAHLPRILGNESFQTVAFCIITVLIGSVEMLKTSHINIYFFDVKSLFSSVFHLLNFEV